MKYCFIKIHSEWPSKLLTPPRVSFLCEMGHLNSRMSWFRFQVADYKSYWNWIEKSFIPTLMPRYWYGPFAINDELLVKEETTTEEVTREKHKKVKKTRTSVSNLEIGFNVLYEYDKGFVADRSTALLVGTARLRQLRIIKGLCSKFKRLYQPLPQASSRLSNLLRLMVRGLGLNLSS